MDQQVVALILDAIVIGLLILYILRGRRKGFLSSLVELVGSIAALVIAGYGSSLLAEFVFDRFLRDSLLASIGSALENQVGISDISAVLAEALAQMPAILSNILQGQLGGALSEDLQGYLFESSMAFATAVVETTVRPIVVSLLTMILFLLLFAALRFVVRLVAKVFKTVTDIPVVGGINRFLGGLMGAVQGVVIILLLVCLLAVFIAMTSGENTVIGLNTINKTLLLRHFYRLNPFLA